MQLDDRKYKILEAIVNDYIQTAEPIGSRTLAKKYGLGISSATIRNEMSDLEEMGLIRQPHTSAGRVPSDKGYRLYVDSMMRQRTLTDEENIFLQQMIINNINQVEYMMQETAKAVASLTNYPAIVSEPYIKKTRIRHVQLVPLDEKTVLLVLVTDAKAVKNQAISFPEAPGYETLTRLSQILNKYLRDKTIRDIDRGTVELMLSAFGPYAYVLMPALGVIVEVIQAEDDVRIFTSGVKNILAFPEFSDISKAKTIFHALEEREVLITILALGQSDRIQILIGAENSLEPLRDCSIIKANYSFDNQSTGCIGIIGPTRMNYAQAVSVLEGIIININAVVRALSGG
ncbi:MAG: heat-inducible transcriptional repressor HrcA [Defluviitaleaceae bacterium]|nr:heat-inducible transcriptional repressor HrcA [Defluviitaleaceae bacterium]